MQEWKEFKYRNLWQHPSWDSFQKSMGLRTWRLDKPGAMALVIRRPLPFDLCWLEVPRGPLFNDEASFNAILEDIKRVAKEENAVFVRFSSYQPLPLQALDTSFDHHPQTSLIIDLSLTEDQILEQMKPKGRYNIKVAEKHGVQVEVSGDAEAFHALLKKTGERDSFGIHDVEYYRNMLAALGQHAQLLMARVEDKYVAGGIFVYMDETAIYYYGASDHHYRNLMAPYLVQWTAIKEAKKRGCKIYDFLGIAPEGATKHPWAGVTEFKQKFGGRVVDYPRAKDLILRPFWYLLYRVKKNL